MTICTACLTTLPAGGRFCPTCGADTTSPFASTGPAPSAQPTAGGPFAAPTSPPPPTGNPAWTIPPPGTAYPPIAPGMAGNADVSKSRTQAMWCHLGPLIMYGASLLLSAAGIGFLISCLCWVPPLIIRNGEGARDPFVRQHATESLNFQLTILIISIPLLFIELLFIIGTGGIGALLVLPIVLALLAFCVWQNIVASIAANKGEPFRYLVNFRMVKN